MKHRIIAAVTALSLLSGCASQEHRDALDGFNQRCTAGEKDACQYAINQEKINHDEARANGWKAAAIAVLLPIVVLGAAVAAREEERSAPVCYSRWRHAYYPC